MVEYTVLPHLCCCELDASQDTGEEQTFVDEHDIHGNGHMFMEVNELLHTPRSSPNKNSAFCASWRYTGKPMSRFSLTMLLKSATEG
eukprot:12365435-Ditylum_brightwellii.AAC.2